MLKGGVIVLVEEDEDDIEIISRIICETFSHHELKIIPSLAEVFEYLSSATQRPFLIICDNNWRNKNQQKLASLIEKFPALKLKSIPFVFYSALPESELIDEAFKDLNVQGYFQKHSNYEEIRKDLSSIIDYWERVITPGSNEADYSHQKIN
ncbi:MAG: hypothetical protein ABIN36_17020 [Ferruginibacter sp.]